MRFKLLGKTWTLKYHHFARPRNSRPCVGDCTDPQKSHRTIRIDPRQGELAMLDTILHEFLHAADWHKDEKWVEHVASDAARLLWRLGYRRTEG